MCTLQTEGDLQDLQRFHGKAGMVYLCNENKEYSCRSKEGWWSTKPVMEVRILPGVQKWSFGRRGVCGGLKIHRTWFNSARLRNMVVVAQLARAPDCGSGGRGFEPLHSPKREYSSVAERMAVNHRVVGSSPSIPANRKYGRAVYGGTPLRC